MASRAVPQANPKLLRSAGNGALLLALLLLALNLLAEGSVDVWNHAAVCLVILGVGLRIESAISGNVKGTD